MSNDALDGLIIDNFAGGGGASTGIELALSRFVDYAINHDPDSIAMHRANHPNTIHLCEDVFAVNPVKLCAGRPVLLAWFSPDCKHFSKAKGGKPADKHIRGLAWVAIKWAKTVRPRIIMLENVEEFKTWGPLGEDGRPIKEKTGTTFAKFVKELENCGYKVEFRELVAADYGAPTKRKRFFLIARSDGEPISWPKADFFPREKCKPGQKTWRSAASIIDFSLPTKSIFNREKDLAEPTKRRIGRGLEKFILKSANPFIIPIGYGENKNQKPRVNDIGDPLMTVVSSTKQNVVVPFLQDALFAKNESRRLLKLEDPHPTVAAVGQHTELLESMLAPFMGLNNFADSGRDIQAPLATVTTNNKEVFLAPKLMPFISKNFGGGFSGAGSDVKEPTPTITAVDHNRLIVPVITDYKFSNDGGRADEPLGTETTIRSHYLTSSYLTEYYGNSETADAGDPLPTVTSKDRHGLVTVKLEKSVELANLGNWPLVREFINKYTTVKVAEDQILILDVGGHDYFISDIGMRMLTPRELYDAQGFPHDYIIDKDFNGRSYPANKQVARCGNAVPPPFAEALVRANLGNLCKKAKISLMKDLAISQSRFLANRTPFNGVGPDGQTSLFSDFEALTKQVAEERKGALRA